VGRALRIDPSSGRVLASVRLSNPSTIAVGEGGVWVSSFWDGNVTRIDPATSRVVTTIKLRLPFAVCTACQGARDFLPDDLAVGAGAIWVASGRGVLARIDPVTNKVATMIRLPGDTTGEVAVGKGAVWVTENVLGVYRVDPTTGHVTAKVTIHGGSARRIAIDHVIVGGGDVYVQGAWARKSTAAAGPDHFVAAHGAAVARIDPVTDQSSLITAAGDLMAFAKGRLWVQQANGIRLVGVDPNTSRVTATLTATPGGHFIAVGRGAAWIVLPDGMLSRMDLPTD
jgi:streptogramin lyase